MALLNQALGLAGSQHDPFTPITLSQGPLSVQVLPQGATLHKVEIDIAGGKRDVIGGPDDPKGHVEEGRKYLTQCVGRYCNRLPGGEVLVPAKDGAIKLQLEKNDNGKVHIHGGSSGYDVRAFDRLSADDALARALFPSSSYHGDAETFFHLHSPDGDQGFPSALDVVVRVAIEPASQASDEASFGQSAGKVLYQIRAKLADGQGPTPVNLTLHAGYCLKSKDEEDGIGGYKLWIDSTREVELDSGACATGKLTNVKGTSNDVSQGNPTNGAGIRPLGTYMSSSGIDNCFVFGSHGLDSPRAILQSPSGDLTLKFWTSRSSVQCYTANYTDGSGTRKALHGSGSKGYPRQGMVFLEFQDPVGTCLHKELEAVAGTDTILRPGEVYDNTTIFEILHK